MSESMASVNFDFQAKRKGRDTLHLLPLVQINLMIYFNLPLTEISRGVARTGPCCAIASLMSTLPIYTNKLCYSLLILIVRWTWAW
jgi:hypothetical protein